MYSLYEMIDCLTRIPSSWKNLLDFVEIGVRIIYFSTYNSVASDPIHQIFDLRAFDEGNFVVAIDFTQSISW